MGNKVITGILRIMLSMSLTTTLAIAISLSKPGCQNKCGHVIIPYPFGIGSNCSANSSFTIICLNSTTPFLTSINMTLLKISLEGTITVNHLISPMNCSTSLTTVTSVSVRGSPFTISAQYNVLVSLGCQNSIWWSSDQISIGSCTSRNIVKCCTKKAFSQRIQEVRYVYQTIQANKSSSCGYVFPVDTKWLKMEFRKNTSLRSHLLNPSADSEIGFAPLVLEWEFHRPTNHSTWSRCIAPDDYGYGYGDTSTPDDYGYGDTSTPDDYGYGDTSTTKFCYCEDGYEGNPYLPGGCSDIDECRDATFLEQQGCQSESCINMEGSFYCPSTWGFSRSRSTANAAKKIIIIVVIVIGAIIGAFILIYGLWKAWKSGKALSKLIKAYQKYKYYKRNGGLLLEQQLASTENGLQTIMLYSSEVLVQATSDYDENRILGRGGQGIVYKGMLADGRLVAVKKSERVSEGDVGVFINEVVIMSQINHRNVVKLLGCCLESKVPLLVYEFVPNGTLFHHIHEPSDEFPLTWAMRVRIATEAAEALSYMHSSASAPIYHRDIKSTNILLDEKYRAKISDFGTSRSISIDKTHLTTKVVGTFGYFDPEYFQSNQFTEKSDVYSFGVVLVELLTGEKAVTSIRAEEGRSLATHFLHSMEENHLSDILDGRVLREGKMEEIEAIAELAKSCLNLNGKCRPTMKEVAMNLEGIRRIVNGQSIEVSESFHFSLIFGNMDDDLQAAYDSTNAETSSIDDF